MATTGTGATGSTSGTGQTNSNASNNTALRGLDMDNFLKLMITELQNQDPLNPMENSEMLNQISQIREIGATDKLTSTLDAVLTGQNLTSASSLIGKEVKALSDDNEQVSGIVDRVTVTNGVPKLHIGDKTVGLNNISDILNSST
jgi:flagellar basal-body rod modification protein FlgD